MGGKQSDEKKTTSPYYTPSKTAADLRNGNSPAKSSATPAPAPDTTQPNDATWDNSNNSGGNNNPPAPDANTWGDGAANNGGGGNNDNWNADGGYGSGGGGNSWDNNNTNTNNTGGENSWDPPPASEPAPAETSNVMPGSWDSIPKPPSSPPPPPWGDTSMAQSTRGAADQW